MTTMLCLSIRGTVLLLIILPDSRSKICFLKKIQTYKKKNRISPRDVNRDLVEEVSHQICRENDRFMKTLVNVAFSK